MRFYLISEEELEAGLDLDDGWIGGRVELWKGDFFVRNGVSIR